MKFDFEKAFEGKRALRKKLASRPVAEKLRMLDSLRQRALDIRSATLKPKVSEGQELGALSGEESAAQLLERILAERREQSKGHGKSKEPVAPDTTKLPSLPQNWTWATLDQLAAPEPNSITDGPFGSKLKTEHYAETGPRVIRLQNIGDGSYLDEKAHISQEHFEQLKKHRIFARDLVIAAFGENPPRACIIPETLGPAIVKADCIRFKPHSSISVKYLNFALNSELVRKRTRGMVHGLGRPRLNLAEIKSIALPIAPIIDQTQIVAEIEKQFSRLDAGVVALKRTQANLKRYRAGVLKAACEGQLVPNEVDLNDAYSFTESGQKLLDSILQKRQGRKSNSYDLLLPNSGSPLPLPKGWVWSTIGEITSSVATGATPLRSNIRYWKDGTIPWVTSGSLNYPIITTNKEFITPLALQETNAKVFMPGTLLIALYGEGRTRGKVAELQIEAATNQACAALLFNSYNECVRPFLKVFLHHNYEAMRLLASGGVQPNLSLSIIKQTACPLPPLAEQKRIVAEVERRLSVVDELEAVVATNLQRAARLRQSILQRAFNGKLV